MGSVANQIEDRSKLRERCKTGIRAVLSGIVAMLSLSACNPAPPDDSVEDPTLSMQPAGPDITLDYPDGGVLLGQGWNSFSVVPANAICIVFQEAQSQFLQCHHELGRAGEQLNESRCNAGSAVSTGEVYSRWLEAPFLYVVCKICHDFCLLWHDTNGRST